MNQKTPVISLPTQGNSQTGFSILAIWVPRTLALRLDFERNNWRALLEGMFDLKQFMDENLQSTVSYHTDLNMDTVVTALRNLFGFVTGVKPQFRAHGGSAAENLALQNIQVRVL